MELIVISDTKLKLILTPQDMRVYGLDFETTDYDSPKNRRSIWRLFDEVKARSGFEVDFDRVLVQVWPSKDGGCEMFISKMGTPPLKGKVPEGAVKYIKQLYAFETLEHLLLVCRALDHMEYKKTSQAWRGDTGKWYLLLEGAEGKATLHPLSFVEEYGSRVSDRQIDMFFEHAKPISTQNAVKILSAFA